MPSQTGSFGEDAMLWQDEDFNKNSQEDDLSMFADIEKPSQDTPTPLNSIKPTIQYWDFMEGWDITDNATNREDLYELNTPTRFPTELTFPMIQTHENASPTFTELVPRRNSTSPNLFTDVDTPPASPQFTDIKDEPDSDTNTNSEPDEYTQSDVCTQPDVLQQALVASAVHIAIPKPVKIENPPSCETTRPDPPVNDKKMVPMMRKYRLTDDELHALSLGELKKLCGRAALDCKQLSKYRRTCMNRFYARKSRTNKATVTQNLEAQLRTAHTEIRKLKQEVARRDRTIAKYEKTNGRLMQ